jgi:hypothetical protein
MGRSKVLGPGPRGSVIFGGMDFKDFNGKTVTNLDGCLHGTAALRFCLRERRSIQKILRQCRCFTALVDRRTSRSAKQTICNDLPLAEVLFRFIKSVRLCKAQVSTLSLCCKSKSESESDIKYCIPGCINVAESVHIFYKQLLFSTPFLTPALFRVISQISSE